MQTIHRLLRAPFFWVATALLILGVASNILSGQVDDSAVQNSGPKIMREGTVFKTQRVHCRSNGERLIVELAQGQTFVVLENLAAERILEAIYEDPTDRNWSVSGMVTEFQDQNFLLLNRVNRSSTPQ